MRPLALIAASLTCGVLAAQPAKTFVNPLLTGGPDPFVTWRGGFYYYMSTTGNGLVIRRTKSLGGLAEAERREVWHAPASGPYSHDVWAPELHFLAGKWYIYFAADAGTNESHRIWVLENASPDPLQGDWVLKGKAADPSDRWAIDATVFEQGGKLFLVWSGWEGAVNTAQNLYLAEMSNPWTVKGDRVRISTPEFPWERVGDLKLRDPEANPGLDPMQPPHVDVNEGPAVLQRNGRIFVIYSAGGCWTDSYSLGMLTAEDTSDLRNPASWRKSPIPVFWQSPKAEAFGPGHNSFFRSPDGAEDWIVYHANAASGQGCGGRRAPRAQRFTWKSDGTPDFGRPVPAGVPIPLPAGELRQ